jgi:hypothetical protein
MRLPNGRQASADVLRKGKWKPMKRASRPARNEAEIVAIQALAFIAEEPQQLSAFLNTTGIPAEKIRAAAREPGFLAGVLEHILGNESLLIAFAASAGIDPAAIARARAALGGQQERNVP